MVRMGPSAGGFPEVAFAGVQVGQQCQLAAGDGVEEVAVGVGGIGGCPPKQAVACQPRYLPRDREHRRLSQKPCLWQWKTPIFHPPRNAGRG